MPLSVLLSFLQVGDRVEERNTILPFHLGVQVYPLDIRMFHPPGNQFGRVESVSWHLATWHRWSFLFKHVDVCHWPFVFLSVNFRCKNWVNLKLWQSHHSLISFIFFNDVFSLYLQSFPSFHSVYKHSLCWI